MCHSHWSLTIVHMKTSKDLSNLSAWSQGSFQRCLDSISQNFSSMESTSQFSLKQMREKWLAESAFAALRARILCRSCFWLSKTCSKIKSLALGSWTTWKVYISSFRSYAGKKEESTAHLCW
jgi:hypothetical protein